MSKNKFIAILLTITIFIEVAPVISTDVFASFGGITNEQLAEMVANGSFENNTALTIQSEYITDISPISELTNLTTLYLLSPNVTDLTPIEQLTELEDLIFITKVADFTPINKLTNLKWLLSIFYNVNGGESPLIDLIFLKDLTNLRGLGLAGYRINDLTPLSGLPRISSLDINSNQITDLTPLHTLTNLHTLSISNNPITFAQLKALQEALPDDCEIVHNVPSPPGHVLGKFDITIFDALEILKYLVNMDSVISNSANAREAALITEESQTTGEPSIFDVLEILKYLVSMHNEIIRCEKALKASLVIPEPRRSQTPDIFDALEILKFLVDMNGILKEHYSTQYGAI